MIALRYVYVLSLVVWLGGALTIGGVVAPAAFAVLERGGDARGGAAAASVVGEVLRRFHLVSYTAGALLLVTLVSMKLVGPRPIGFGRRLAIVGTMLLASVVSGMFVDAAIGRLRTSIGRPVGELDPADPQRVRFGQLHAMSTGLMGLVVIGGLALCYWETRE